MENLNQDNKTSLHDITDTFSEADISSYLKWQKKQNIGFIPPLNYLKLDSIIPFGKYKGNSVAKILQIDKNYIVWLGTTSNNKLSNEVKNLLF